MVQVATMDCPEEPDGGFSLTSTPATWMGPSNCNDVASHWFLLVVRAYNKTQKSRAL